MDTSGNRAGLLAFGVIQSAALHAEETMAVGQAGFWNFEDRLRQLSERGDLLRSLQRQ
jgi:hypothetical protein